MSAHQRIRNTQRPQLESCKSSMSDVHMVEGGRYLWGGGVADGGATRGLSGGRHGCVDRNFRTVQMRMLDETSHERWFSESQERGRR